MIFEYEAIDFGDSIPIKCFVHNLGYSGWHWHESMEMLFFLEGYTDVTVEDKQFCFSSGDIILINSREPHELRSTGSLIMAVQIDMNRFDKKITGGMEARFSCNTKLSDNSEGFERLRQLFAEFIQAYASEGRGQEAQAKSVAYAILSILQRFFPAEPKETAFNQQMLERLAEIIRYINEHYHEPLTLAELAKHEYLSIPYLSSFFRKGMRMTFRDYLNSVRLNEAVSLLMNTDATIEEISDKAGFPNPRTFSRVFLKTYNVLPSIYRLEHGNADGMSNIYAPKLSSNEYTIVNSKQYLRYFTKYLQSEWKKPTYQSSPLRRQLSISMHNEGRKLRHTWRTFLSVASAKDLLMERVQKMILRAQQEIGFTYVNFHGLLSDDMRVCSRDAYGKLQFSFTYVDAALDFVLKAGLKPVIQLSFMPKVLAMHPERTIFHTCMINSPPTKMEEWNLLIVALYKHLAIRYGETSLQEWLFVIWNEPDTPLTMFGFEKARDFYRFYKATYRALKELQPNLKIGAPAIYLNVEDDASWLRSFASWTKEQCCIPDFLLIHYYGTQYLAKQDWQSDVLSQPMRITTDADAMERCVHLIHALAKELYDFPMPVYLSEWNFTPSHADLLNDTCFASCYIVRSILKNYDSLDAFCHWMLTDLCEENPIPSELFHGGMGLFTFNGIAKASYYAYRFLSKLGDCLVANGEGYFVTSKGNDYIILVYNYAHYSKLYAQGELLDMSLTERYTPFAAAQACDAHFTFTQIRNGRYQVTEHILSRASGSSYDLWAKTGDVLLCTEEDYNGLASRSVPEIRHSLQQVTDHTLHLHFTMDILEVRLIELQRSRDA